MNRFLILFVATLLHAQSFLVSVGGFGVCLKKHTSYLTNCPYGKRVPLFAVLPNEMKNVNSITMWITKDWKKDWYPVSTVNTFVKKGYTPIFIFYYFGDDISYEFVKKHEKDYFRTLKRFKNYLKKIKGAKYVVLNPEYNENGMASSKYFDYIQVRSIALLKSELSNVQVGICLGDFGNYDLIWDEVNWNLNARSMQESAKVSDFIAFQEMRALTRNKHEQIRKTSLRALAFALYLHQKYKKPTFLAYMAISSYTDERLQKDVFKNFVELLPLFKHGAHLIGIGAFHYIDVPTHKGYFKQAEKYFGLKRADGSPKPSYFEFRKIH